ncbi:23S rRNA pseudouridine(1911/1915/1917) synthase RluD [Buchnera aphidicola]|uniref:23S rRNA pseudouridine(1911/1915/1917) synthase RluD n=1 Tax=Buchnera aphidicola TaxID=9 RepID=UPI003CE4F7A0
MKETKLSTTISCISLFGKRLDQVLSIIFNEYSRSYLKKMIIMNQVAVNGIIINIPDKKILGKETITIYLKNEQILYDLPENISLNIIYEDDHILVINKPDGLVVHPGSGHKTGTILNALLYYDKNIRNVPRSGIVHRLDKNTTGLMVIAKNIFSYNYLVKLLKERKIVRKYQGIVTGNVISGGTINQPIMRHPIKRTCMTVNRLGKTAITHYTIINRFKNHTHISIRLETGRTHQIRVHMSYIKHPLFGDPCYSNFNNYIKYKNDQKINQVYKFSRQALHANYLSFLHPVRQNLMSWTIPFPKDMIELISKLS